MIIVSWDVGVIHLAYCVLQYDGAEVIILDWDVINLMEDHTINLRCCGMNKAGKTCDKNATYYLDVDKLNLVGFCKTHLSQSNNYWTQDLTKKLFKGISTGKMCSHLKLNGQTCGKKAKCVYRHSDEKLYLCNSHLKSHLKKKLKDFSPKLIHNLIVKKYPTSELQLTLIKKLDTLAEHFAKLQVEEIIIENQPSHKNPKMKSISNTLFDYFLIRGYIDKFRGLNINLVRFMCPSNKLKVNNDNTIEVFKAKKDSKKYKLTKDLSIEYTKQLLDDDDEQLQYLQLYKKKDDICDAYLQGRYYLEFIRNKK